MMRSLLFFCFSLASLHLGAQSSCLRISAPDSAPKSLEFRVEMYRNQKRVHNFLWQNGDTLCGTLPPGSYRLVAFSHNMAYHLEMPLVVSKETPEFTSLVLEATKIKKEPNHAVYQNRRLSLSSDEMVPTALEEPSMSSLRSDKAAGMATMDAAFESSEAGPGAPTGAGKLTAREVNDFIHWDFWTQHALDSLQFSMAQWHMFPQKKYGLKVQSSDGQALVDVPVFLENEKGHILWSGRTNNTGTAELWADFFSRESELNIPLFLRAEYRGQSQTIRAQKKHHRYRKLSFQVECPSPPKAVDIAFVIDATGSMGDELNYLQTELEDVMQKAQTQHKALDFRTAAVVYRDLSDSYVTQHQDFKPGSGAAAFLKEQRAGGGGDFPEAVDQGLMAGIQQLSWSSQARARILFLVLDAPAHKDPQTVRALQRLTAQAAEKGIRIVPLACSGMDADAEFLSRAMALATNGTYTALTDDSGIGNSHRSPVAGTVDKDKLNKMLLQIIHRFVYVPDCEKITDTQAQELPQDHLQEILENELGPQNPGHNLDMTVFPNPTHGPLRLQWKGNLGPAKIRILDMHGRSLLEYEVGWQNSFRTDDGYTLSKGLYYIVFENSKHRIVKRFIRS